MYKCILELIQLLLDMATEEMQQWNYVRKNTKNLKAKTRADFCYWIEDSYYKATTIVKEELTKIMNDLMYVIIYKTWNEKRLKWSFYTKRKMIVSGEENLGLQDKTLTVIFSSSIDITNLGTGVYVLNKNINKMPSKYTISEDSNGNKKYPYFYINEIEKFIPEGVYTV